VHDTVVNELHAVLLQALDSKTDDVGVKFAASAKLRPLIVMMPPPESAVLIGSLELTTGAANPHEPVHKRLLSESRVVRASAEYRRS
jgi:hypothetical protein